MESFRSLGASASPSDQKAAIMDQIRQENAVANARQLIDKINEHCFDKCVPKPGTSLSKGEQTCFTSCMEKYMAAWNAASQQYIRRMQQEQGGPGVGLA